MSSKCPFAAQWDQRETLKPPPFTGPMKRLTLGLETCDKAWESIEHKVLVRAARNIEHIGTIKQSDEPSWIDYEQLERGQALWGQRIGSAFVALNAALMQVHVFKDIHPIKSSFLYRHTDTSMHGSMHA